MKCRLVKITDGVLSAESNLPFTYRPLESDEKITGILMTRGSALSMGINNGTEIVFEHFSTKSDSTLSPDEKVFSCEIQLSEFSIKGVLQKENPTVGGGIASSLYFIVQQKNENQR